MKVNFIKCAFPTLIGSLAVLLGSGNCSIGKTCSLEDMGPGAQSSYSNTNNTASSATLSAQTQNWTISAGLGNVNTNLEGESKLHPIAIIGDIDGALKSEADVSQHDKDEKFGPMLSLTLLLAIISLFALAAINSQYFLLLKINKNKFFKQLMTLSEAKNISQHNNFLISIQKLVYSKIKSLYHNAQSIGSAFIQSTSFSYHS